MILRHTDIQNIELVPFSVLTEEDNCKQLYLKWINDYEVVKYINSLELLYPKDEAFLEKSIVRFSSDYCKGYLIFARDTGSYVGTIKLDKIDYFRGSAEVGIMIGEKSEWGKGYGKFASIILLDFAFKGLGLRRIWGGCCASNHGMKRLFTSLGFVHEGTLRESVFIEGSYNDSLLFGLLNREYRDSIESQNVER